MPDLDSARAWYDSTDPVHGFEHVRRVYHLARHLALSEGADVEIVCAAALLHDADGAHVREPCQRSAHQHASAEFARQALAAEGWPEERISAVVECIRAHRFRGEAQPPQTLEAKVLFDADKLDAIGAIGVMRAIAYSLQNGQPVFAPPSARFLQSWEREPGEPHSAYHEFLFKLSRIKPRLNTPTARRLAEARHAIMEQFFHALLEELQQAE